MNAKMLWMSSPNSIKHFQVINIIKSLMDYYEVIASSDAPSFDKLEIHQPDFFYCSALVFVYTLFLFIVLIAIHVVHLKRVYNKAKFALGFG